MSITITEAAAERVKHFIEKRGHGVGLRLNIKQVGCSGYAYDVDYVDELAPGDVVFEQHGVKLVVRPDVLPMVDGTEVDYKRQGLNEGFEFSNPNVKSMCGCGESFSV